MLWTKEDARTKGPKLVSFTKGFPKHPHILVIFKLDSEYLRFSFKVKVDYFILYSILVYSFVIFLIFFAMSKRRCMFETEQFFHSNVYMFKRKQNERRLFNMWSAGFLISVLALKEHSDIYLYFSLNDRLLISVVSLGFTIRTVRTPKNSLRFLFFLPLSSYCNQIY